MTRRRVVALAALVVVGAVAGVAGAAFVATTSNPASTIQAQRIYSGQRSESAWNVTDASSGTASNKSAPMGFAGDGLTYTTGAWTTAFSSTRYVDLDFNGSLPAGLSVSGVEFNFGFQSNAGSTACMYFDVRRASTGAVLGTFGSSGSPVACQGTTLGRYSTDISSVVTSTDIANDLRIRIYGKEASSKSFLVDLATVTGSGYGPFTLYRTKTTDAATGTPATAYWEINQTGEGAVLTTGNWATSFSSTRYLRFAFPGYVPLSATLTDATFDFTYKANTASDNVCYYFEVYQGTTLLATHGSTGTPVDCNATTSFKTTSTPLAEVNTIGEANNLVVKLYARDATGARAIQVDGVALKLTFSLGYGTGCADVGTVTYQATADAYVDQNAPTTNAGTATTIDVMTNGTKARRTLVTFPLPSALGSGCSITAATLRLYLSTTGGARTVDTYQANAAWTETGVTWNTQPATTGSAVSTASGSAGTWMTWSVTSMVQSMVSGTNYGFLLRDSNEASGNVKQSFMSREAANLPELVVTYG